MLPALVLAVGVHHRQRGRQGRAAQVVVDDQHLGPRLDGGGDRLVGERAAVEAQDQRALGRQRPHRGDVGPVALGHPVGDVDPGGDPHRPQPAHQQRGRGGAVHVVVAEEADLLACARRAGQAVGGEVHVAQHGGVGHQLAQGRGEIGRRRLRHDPARGQHAADHLRRLEALGDGEAEPLCLRARPDPAAAEGGALHVQEGVHEAEGYPGNASEGIPSVAGRGRGFP